MSQLPPTATADRNLLFGILALQLNFIGRDALIAAMNAWVLDKAKPLGQVLLEQGRLTAEQVQALDALIGQHLKAHGDDPEQSLRSLSSASSVCASLTPVEDDDVQASLAKFGAAPPIDGTISFPRPAGNGMRYRRLRPHAEGGLGKVFVAEDTELTREVALKEIKEKNADDPVCRRRFLLEGEITGGLEHPGIVPVYGMGTYDDGRPYYAMRFIRGETLKTAVERFHAPESSSQSAGERRLAFCQLLRRFIDVCNAIAYAHSRGVLHRDLKPANIMLGKFGETLVVDWGLAKAVGESAKDSPWSAAVLQGQGEPGGSSAAGYPERLLRPSSGGSSDPTRLGTALGTPAYMSPEQAAGRLDELGPISDIYSLGATLYVLLTGRRPFQGDDILAQVERGEFPSPRQVKPDTPPALNAICMKAMAPKSADRYQLALDLAADVEHWLADEPVAAYPEPWTARLGRWGRRHRTALVAAAVLLVSAVVALSASTALVWAEQQETAAQKKVAEENYVLSRDQSFQIIDLIEKSEADIASFGPLHKPRTDIMVLASKACRRYLEQEPKDVELRRRTAQVFRFTANVHRLNYESAAAGPLYRDSLQIYEGLEGQFPEDVNYKLRVSETLRDHAKFQSNLGKLKAAAESLHRSLAIAEKLRETDPDRPQWQRGVATVELSLASLEYTRGNYADSGKIAGRAAEVFRKLSALPPGESRPYDPVLLAAALNILAVVERESGRLTEAREAHKEPVKMLYELSKKPPPGVSQPDVAHFFLACQLAQCHTQSRMDNPKARDNAEAGLTTAIGSWTELVRRFPGIPMYREELAEAYQLRGQVRAEKQREKEAASDYEKRLATARADLDQARKLQEARVQESPEMPGPHGDLGRTYLELGRMARSANNQAEATGWFTKAEEALTKAMEQAPDHARNRRSLAEVRAASAL